MHANGLTCSYRRNMNNHPVKWLALIKLLTLMSVEGMAWIGRRGDVKGVKGRG